MRSSEKPTLFSIKTSGRLELAKMDGEPRTSFDCQGDG